MNAEYVKLIAEHDETLSFLRDEWTRASVPLKGKWMRRINAALDIRLDLMKTRDMEVAP